MIDFSENSIDIAPHVSHEYSRIEAILLKMHKKRNTGKDEPIAQPYDKVRFTINNQFKLLTI